ncbi:PREDICTED: golgin subfamily A member 3 isoform X2 [Condylura cristata]|uniref:golgin subfamily A member 3 isoform X2 n=1 Tax=Condylura cristata TaxID=143302 RepID=UPI000642A9B4|nr:PREDICTED: golgin subfamily A member 3 isoform X2 [Condylura cristata]
MAKPDSLATQPQPLRASPTCVVLTMDSTSAVQGGLSEDGASGGPSPHSEEPLDSLVPTDSRDGAQCAGVEADGAVAEEEGPDVPGQESACANGPVPLSPRPTTSPLVPDASPGSTDTSPPLEKEEQVRLQARKRLEEQLKQYRVKRQQERSNQPATKTRLFSTLDPELMLNPEALPRASTVAMTKEYSFLRTSVPRGPKVGSLGLLAQPKEKKSSKSSKIRSLADYRTDDSAAGSPRTLAADVARGSLRQNRSSATSVVSEISPCPKAEDHPESASLGRDDASEAGDGNESDNSSHGSVSARGLPSRPVDTVGPHGASGVPSGQEAALGTLGQFPSISDVLHAAAAEHQAQGQEINGETRSRTDSICSSLSLESSVAEAQEEMLQVLKEKRRLEGQLEALSLEASQALKEKVELQAQLAALDMRLQAQVEQSQSSQQRQDSLSSEVDTLKQSCWDLERAMADLQSLLEARNASLASSNSDLQVAEEQYQRLLAKVEEMQGSLRSKDNAVQDLRQQMSALQSQLQQVQLERSTLSSRLKASQAEISSLQSVRQWYQQQLALAQEARVRLQGEMAHIQVGQMTQAGLLEHLKLENVALSHQLTETQHRSIKEKERIAAQLQGIEADMLDQEAAFVQIQEAKTMVEEDLQRRLEEFEDEKEQLQKMAASAAALEQQLEQMKLTLQQRDQQFEALQQDHLDLLKQLTSTQEVLQTREQCLDDLQGHQDKLQARLEELQTEATAREDTIQFLQKEKIVLEVALQAAKSSREEFDRGAKSLEEGSEDTSEILEQLRQELAVKSSQVEHLQQETAALKKQMQKVKEQFLQQKVMVEAYRRDSTSKDQLVSELKATKKRLDSAQKELRQELLKLQGEKKSVELEHSRLQKEASQARQQVAELEGHLKAAQVERDEAELQLQSLQFDKEQAAALSKANEALQKQVEALQQEARKAVTEQKQKVKRLGSDLSSARKEAKSKHKAYENAVGILSRRLQEALAAQEAAEVELSRLSAQVAGDAQSLALQERVRALEEELQTVSRSKLMLEKELQEVITLTSQELEEHREKVLELEDELQESRGFRRKIKRLEESNNKLALELEHERGKLTGLGQSNAALREHNSILETALAKREANLVQLNLQVQAILQRKEEEDQQIQQLIDTLQASLEREKLNANNLKEQVAAAKMEAGHNRRHFKAASLELSEVKKELQAKEHLVQKLQEAVEELQIQEGQHSQEAVQFREELAEARAQLLLLQQQLDEQLSKQPTGDQEMENLKWEVEQKEREVQSLKQQLGLSEQHAAQELGSLQQLLQDVRSELETAQEDLSVTQKDKLALQAKVSELKSSMKTLLQQNQQLQRGLRRSTKTRKELKGEANSSSPVTPVKIPDCPVPASLLEELLKPPPAVSKEPLKNLNSCLQQLKQEMHSLQRQMEAHTVTVHESLSSWPGADSTTSPPSREEHAHPGGDTEKHSRAGPPEPAWPQ